MNYYKFLQNLDKQLKTDDKILCQFLLLERININCSFLSIFENLKNKYNEQDSFNYLLNTMRFLKINFHCHGICPEASFTNCDYKIDDKKMFLVNLYKECSDEEFNYLLKRIFNLNHFDSCLNKEKLFPVLLDFISKPWNGTLKRNLIKFAADKKIKGIEQLVCENLGLFNGYESQLGPINRCDVLDNYEIYEDRIDLCLIYNAHAFKTHSHRSGSEFDVNIIKETFETIRGFEVKIEVIESKEFLHESLSQYTKQCKQSDMIVCFFMSHGKSSSIFAENDDEIEIWSILDMFTGSRCRYLRNKPKLLIFQSCRGDEINRLIDSDSCPIQCDGDPDRQRITCPAVSDYFLYFSTCNGCVANRTSNSGSEFIQLLCETIKNNHKIASWNKIYMTVNGSDSIYNNGVSIQIPEINSTFRKELYFDFIDIL